MFVGVLFFNVAESLAKPLLPQLCLYHQFVWLTVLTVVKEACEKDWKTGQSLRLYWYWKRHNYETFLLSWGGNAPYSYCVFLSARKRPLIFSSPAFPWELLGQQLQINPPHLSIHQHRPHFAWMKSQTVPTKLTKRYTVKFIYQQCMLKLRLVRIPPTTNTTNKKSIQCIQYKKAVNVKKRIQPTSEWSHFV